MKKRGLFSSWNSKGNISVIFVVVIALLVIGAVLIIKPSIHGRASYEISPVEEPVEEIIEPAVEEPVDYEVPEEEIVQEPVYSQPIEQEEEYVEVVGKLTGEPTPKNSYQPLYYYGQPLSYTSPCSSIKCWKKGEAVACTCAQVANNDGTYAAGGIDVKNIWSAVETTHINNSITGDVSSVVAYADWMITGVITCELEVYKQSTDTWYLVDNTCKTAEALYSYNLTPWIDNAADAKNIKFRINASAGDKKLRVDQVYIEINTSAAPEVDTDRDEYIETKTAYISGTGFTSNNTATIDIRNPSNVSVAGYPKNVSVNSTGDITDSWYIASGAATGNYSVYATDVSSLRTASAVFEVLPDYRVRQYPAGSFLIPMDNKQSTNSEDQDFLRAYGMVWRFLNNSNVDFEWIITPPCETLQTKDIKTNATYNEEFCHGFFITNNPDAWNYWNTNFKNDAIFGSIVVHNLTSSNFIRKNNLIYLDRPMSVAVLDDSEGEITPTLDPSYIPYDIITEAQIKGPTAAPGDGILTIDNYEILLIGHYSFSDAELAADIEYFVRNCGNVHAECIATRTLDAYTEFFGNSTHPLVKDGGTSGYARLLPENEDFPIVQTHQDYFDNIGGNTPTLDISDAKLVNPNYDVLAIDDNYYTNNDYVKLVEVYYHEGYVTYAGGHMGEVKGGIDVPRNRLIDNAVLFAMEITDNVPPTWSDIGQSATSVAEGIPVYLWARWRDNRKLKLAVLSINDGSGWVNITNQTLVEDEDIANFTFDTTGYGNKTIQWKIYARDFGCGGNWNVTDLGDNLTISGCYDNDGDGHYACDEHGNPILGCNNATNATCDCDDNDNQTYPGAPEICDGKDNDCDNQTDEGLPIACYNNSDCGTDGCISGTYYIFKCNNASTCFSYCSNTTSITDNDGDGYDTECDGDCDDNDNTTYPGAPELCDGKDNDCDNLTDDGWSDDNCSYICTGNNHTWLGTFCCGDDIGEDSPYSTDENTEALCSDSNDNDCDGYTDCDDPGCNSTVVCDTTPLQVYIISPESYPKWYNSYTPFVVKANVTDGAAGADIVMFRWENATHNGTYIVMTYNATTGYYEAAFNVTSIAEGYYTFRVWANDTNSNINDTETVANVAIDYTPPATSDNAPADWQNSDFSFNITCYDATSGCAAIYYSLTGILPFTAVNTSGPLTLSITTEGIYPLYYYAVDYAANNEYNTTLRTQLKLDKTSPNTTINYTSTGWQDSDIVFSLSCYDALSGCNSTWYCIDTANTCNPFNGTQYTAPVTHSTEGVYYVRFGSTDNADNNETVKSQVLKIDKSAPSVPPYLYDPGNYTTTGNVTLNWTAAVDNVSGIHHYELWRSTNNVTFAQVDGDLSNTTLSYEDSGLMNNRTYYYYVVAVDNAGNNATSNTEYITVDTENPGVEIIYPADGQYFITDSVEIRANFSNTNLVNCEVRNNGIWHDMDNDNATSGIANYTFTGLADGIYNFTVRCTDESNLSGTDSVVNVVVDTTDPTGSITINSGAAYTNTTPVTLSLTYYDALSGVDECRYSNDGGTYTSWMPCTATKAWNLSAGDGTKTVYYQVKDNAGNTATFTDTIILDTTEPIVYISSPPNGTYTNDTTPEINFTITDNIDTNIYYVVLVDGVQDQAGYAANGSLITINISNQLLETTHNITIKATDDAGNSGTDEIILTVLPLPPVVVINSPSYDGYTTSDTTPEITFTLTDNSDNLIDYVIFIDSSPMAGGTGTAQYGVPVSKNLTTLSEGYHNITVQGTDDSGNSANATRVIVIDTTDPVSVINSPADGTYTNDNTPEINFTLTDNLDDNISYVIYIDGVADGTGTASNGTLTSVNLTAVGEGNHTIIVEGTDNAGNSANSTPVTLIVDLTDPVCVINSPADGTYTTDTTPEINFTLTDNLDDNISYVIYIDGVPDGTGTASNGTLTSVNLTALADGNHTITVEGTDDAGNTGSSTITIYIDTTPPSVEDLQPAAGTSYSQYDSVLISANVTDAVSGVDTVTANITWDYDSALVELIYNNATGLYEYDFNKTGWPGTYYVGITANDTLGHVNDTESTYFIIEPSGLPVIVDYYAVPMFVETGKDVELFEDVINASWQWANITLPNGTSVIVQLHDGVPYNWTTFMDGRHNVTFYANNSLGTVNTEQLFFIAGPLVNVTVDVINNTLNGMPSNLTVWYLTYNVPPTPLYSANGSFNFQTIGYIYDFEFTTYEGDLIAKLKDIDISYIGAPDLNRVEGFDQYIAYPGYIITYAINNTYNASGATVIISYDDAVYSYEPSLEVWQCLNWIFTSRECCAEGCEGECTGECEGEWINIDATQNDVDNTFTFDTTTYGAFSIKQGPYCGDNIINNGEECDGEDLGDETCKTLGFSRGELSCTQSCTFDTSECSKGGGGGGGGGGGCLVKWNCTEWGPCLSNGIQTRICIDLNECGTDWGKPAETQECEYLPEIPPREEKPEEIRYKPSTSFVPPEEEEVIRRGLVGQAYLFATSASPWPFNYLVAYFFDLIVWIAIGITTFFMVYSCRKKKKGEVIVEEGAGIVWTKKHILGKKK